MVSWVKDGETLLAVPVPVTLRILIERREHYGQDGFNIVADQVAEIFVVPEVKCSLGHLRRKSAILSTNSTNRAAHLEMRAGNRFGQLIE